MLLILILLKNLLFIYLFLFFFQITFAQKVRYSLHLIYQVNNPDNYRFKKDVFIFKDTAQIYQKLSLIKSELIDKGFLSASIDSTVKNGFNYFVYLFVGRQYKWKLIADSLEMQVLNSLHINKNTFRQQNINLQDYLKQRKQLLEYFNNSGYPFAQIKIEKLLIKQNLISGYLQLKKNQKIVIDTIYIKGKLRVSPKLIYRNIDIKPGDYYNSKKLNQIDENIEKMSFAGILKPAEIEFFPDKADIYLYMKKKKANFFSGIIGFASDENKTNNLKLTGNVLLNLNNSFALGEHINLRWDSYADSSQYLFIRINFPYLLFVPFGMGADFELDKSMLNYLNVNYAFRISYDFKIGNRLSLYYRRKQSFLINTDDTLQDINASDYYTLGMGAELDKFNRLVVPQKGYKISISTGYGSRNLQNTETKNLLEVNLSAAYYLFFNKMFNVCLQNVSAGIFNKKGFYENELFKLGGIKTVRGFDEKSMSASAYSIFSIEPRLFVSEYSFLSVFADYIYYQTEGINLQTINSGVGLGTGINMDTKAGVFSLYFAVGSLNGQPFKISNTKLHFGYMARF